MRSLSVSDAVSQGWEFAKKHGLLLAAIIFGFSILTGMINSLAVPQDFWANNMKAVQSQDMNSLQKMMDAYSPSVLSNIVSTILYILYIIFYAGFTATLLKLIRGIMVKVSFEGFKMSAMTYLKYFVVNLLVGLIIVVGSFLCLVPGIFFATRLAFADWYILDHPDAGIGEAFSASWNMTKGNFWSVLGLLFTEIVIVMIGFLLCCIGMYFAVPLAMFVEGCAYLTLHENLPTAAPVNEYVQDEH